MAHFAQIDENNQVAQVIVVNNNVITDELAAENEQQGIDFCKTICGKDTQWLQTSYNASFRKNFASVGFTFDQQRNAFIPPQPFTSWVLNEETCRWTAPLPCPSDGNYEWDEETVSWVPANVTVTDSSQLGIK